jgi:hypothetical protein
VLKRIVLGVALGFVLAAPALAQQPVLTNPSSASTLNASGTIAVTNTFQSVFAAAAPLGSRQGCLVQNTGTHTMNVYFGPVANATLTNSFQIVPIGSSGPNSISCSTGAGGVVQDQVSITGTATETFTATRN